MKQKIKLILPKIIFVLIMIFFLISLPAIYSNNKNFNQIKNDAREMLDQGYAICSSNCTDYPTDWVVKGQEKEAELYCRNQCADNMLGIRKGVINNFKPMIFENRYDYIIEGVYCVLGLKCFSSDIEDYVYGYIPKIQ